MKTKISSLYIIGALILVGCTSDPTEPTRTEPSTPYFEAPITLTFGSTFDIDVEPSRAAPPGAGTGETLTPDNGIAEYQSINEVRVVTFRRKEYTSDPFVYDAANDLILEIKNEAANPEHGHAHHQAQGKIKKVSGFEYKIVALAYDNARVSSYSVPDYATSFKLPTLIGDQNRFKLNISDGLNFEDFRADILTEEIGKSSTDWVDFYRGYANSTAVNILETTIHNRSLLSDQAAEFPQIFYGECQTETGNEIINFVEEFTEIENGEETLVQKTDVGIQGILYRGMAKVDVNIKVKKHDMSDGGIKNEQPMNWLCLMVQGVNTSVSLINYDGFLSAGSPIEKYTPVSYYDLTNTNTDETITISTYLLPGKYKLALRSKTTQMLTYHMHDGEIEPADVENYGNGTGIVSPDANDGYFYIRRNHKYVLNISDSEKILYNHKL